MKTQLQPIVIHGASIQAVSDKSKVLDMTGRQRMYRDGYKGESVIVAVVDTGVNGHAELGIDHETGAGFCTFGLPVEERLKLGEAKIWVNGIEKVIDVIPVVINQRTFTPTRHTHESLGDKVDWLQDTQEVIITRY